MYVHQCMTTNKCFAFASYEGNLVKTSHYRDGHDLYVLFQYMFCTFTVKIACTWNHSLISYWMSVMDSDANVCFSYEVEYIPIIFACTFI